MTLTKEVKDLLADFFRSAFSNALEIGPNDRPPDVVILDFMQFVKYLPDSPDMNVLSDMINYFVKRAMEFMHMHPSVYMLIIMVDGAPLAAKSAVAHVKRHSEDDPNKAPLATNGGPYLPTRDQDLIMDSARYTRFSKNYLLLRRELYPRLFNAFMTLRNIDLPPGKEIVLSGFPGRNEWRSAHVHNPWEAPRNDANNERTVALWDALPITEDMERADPKLYHRTWVVKNLGPHVVRYEWERAENDISEGDVRMFWFSHFFANQHVLLCINDGDVFSIGLLHSQERLRAIAPAERSYDFSSRHTIVMPNRAADAPSRYTYVDLNRLYALVREYPPMRKAKIQHPAATMALLITLSGTDFCPKFFHGMGWRSIIWNTFFSNAALFTHLVMISEALPGNTRRWRDVILDEEAFEQFTRLCFAAKYDADLKKNAKKLKRETSMSDLRERTRKNAKGAPQADVRFHWPESANVVRAYARATLWTLQYWKNAPAGHTPNALEMYCGMPYYPYWRNPATDKPQFIQVVCPQVKPVDPVYRRRHADTALLLQQCRESHALLKKVVEEGELGTLALQGRVKVNALYEQQQESQ